MYRLYIFWALCVALARLIAQRTWQHVDLYTCFVTPVHTLCKHEFDTMQAVCGRCTPSTAHPSSVYDICALCTARSAPNQASAAYTVRCRHAIACNSTPAGQASQLLANTMQAEYGWLALVTARPLGVCRVCTLLTCIPSHIYAHMATQARLGPQVRARCFSSC